MDIRTPIPTNYGGQLKQFGDVWKSQVAQLQSKFGGAIEEVRMPMDYPTDVPIVYVNKESIIPILEFIRTDAAFDYGYLSDITATDEQIDPRFEVVYQMYSMSRHNRIRLKVRVRENEDVPTAVSLWPAANWAEREIFDMFGIKFKGHPDLRRILMDERWVGHPLRKDYPLRGYQIFPDAQQIRPELLED